MNACKYPRRGQGGKQSSLRLSVHSCYLTWHGSTYRMIVTFVVPPSAHCYFAHGNSCQWAVLRGKGAKINCNNHNLPNNYYYFRSEFPFRRKQCQQPDFTVRIIALCSQSYSDESLSEGPIKISWNECRSNMVTLSI